MALAKALRGDSMRLAFLGALVLGLGACEGAAEIDGEGAHGTASASYANERWQLRFEYPPEYYLRERGDDTPAGPQLAVVLVEDTPTHRAIVEGRATEAMDGPTAITIDAYQNRERLDARDWFARRTNWGAVLAPPTPAIVAGLEGIAFDWDGLYRGRSIVVASGDRAYVLSVTWLTPEDRIVGDFERLLESVRLADAGGAGGRD